MGRGSHFYPVIRHPATKKMLVPELDVMDNLVPSCKPCNNFKHSSKIEGFRWDIEQQFTNTLKSSTGLRQLDRLGLIDLTPKPVVFWYEREKITMPTVNELIGISEAAQEVEWKKDESEYESYYHEFDDGICTLRHVGSQYLAIYKLYGWEEKGRKCFDNSRRSIVMAKAAEWALSL